MCNISRVKSNSYPSITLSLIKKSPELQNKVTSVLRLLAEDPFTPSLKSHKLTGNLSNLWSCSVTYDCRIIFIFDQDECRVTIKLVTKITSKAYFSVANLLGLKNKVGN